MGLTKFIFLRNTSEWLLYRTPEILGVRWGMFKLNGSRPAPLRSPPVRRDIFLNVRDTISLFVRPILVLKLDGNFCPTIEKLFQSAASLARSTQFCLYKHITYWSWWLIRQKEYRNILVLSPFFCKTHPLLHRCAISQREISYQDFSIKANRNALSSLIRGGISYGGILHLSTV